MNATITQETSAQRGASLVGSGPLVRPICPKCGREMGMIEQCITGFPNHHVKGSRRDHCFHCGPAHGVLVVGRGRIDLVPNNEVTHG